MDWQGDLNLHCYVCTDEAEGCSDVDVKSCDIALLMAFRKRCKKSWEDRLWKSKDHYNRARPMSYKQAQKDVEVKSVSAAEVAIATRAWARWSTQAKVWRVTLRTHHDSESRWRFKC
jgi:hypothetical protein